MRRILSLSSVIALTVMMSSFSYGQTVLEIDFEDSGVSSPATGLFTETFGSQVDNVLLSDLALNPLTITLNPDTGSNSSEATSGVTGDARDVPLQITVLSGTGTGPGAAISCLLYTSPSPRDRG